MSNKWLVDVVDAQFLTFSYLDVAQRYGYHFIQTEVTAFERDKKRVITAQGWVDYDYLISAPASVTTTKPGSATTARPPTTPRRCSRPPTSRTPSISSSSRASRISPAATW